ncbi:MAG: choice-of-anchor Q domain-containing protein [Armatimonadota bacterium]
MCLAEIGSGQEGLPYYYHAANSEGFFQNALQAGWHVGPSIGIDSQTTPGDQASTRHTGIWAYPYADREQIMDALRQRRVFASEDGNAQLSLECKIDGDSTWHWMGERISLAAGSGTDVRVILSDADTSNPSDYYFSVLLLCPGRVMSDWGYCDNTSFTGQVHLSYEQMQSVPVTQRGERCLYVRASQKDGEYLFSAPVWISFYTPTVATPSFNPDGGTFGTEQDVSVTCSTSGVAIHYTTNGSDPVESDPVIASGSSIHIDRNTVLKARAFKNDWNPSSIKSAGYVFVPATPTFNPTGGFFETPQNIRIDCATANTVIHYTTNGDDPSESAAALTPGGTVYLNKTCTLKARAYRTGWNASEVRSDIYHFPIHVKWDEHDGVSWDTAYLVVQDGLNAAIPGDQVWVAAGTYAVTWTDYYGFAFGVEPGTAVFGGFEGSEQFRDQRDWNGNVTILDCQWSGSVMVLGGEADNTCVDGFTLSNGGGIQCWGSPTIQHNTMVGGWGITCYDGEAVIANNFIIGNAGSASGYGGCDLGRAGVWCELGAPAITNNTIVANAECGVGCRDSAAIITNNVIAFNAQGVAVCGGSPVLRNNCVYNPGGDDYLGTVQGIGDICADPKLVAPQYGRVHLQSGSPCVDAGNDSVVGNGSTDIDGQGRVQGSHADIGADESDGTTWNTEPVIVRVSTSGDDGNDGSDWAHAKRTAQAGVDAAASQGGEVWVAEGIYTGDVQWTSSNPYGATLLLRPFAYAYGGFSGTESSRDTRDWFKNKTVIDGRKLSSVVLAFGGHLVSSLDGFDICNGYSNGAGLIGPCAGGISCYYSSPIICHNVIDGNTGANGPDAGGIGCVASRAIISNNVVMRNSGSEAGGIYCNDGSPTVINNTITANQGCLYRSDGIYSGAGGIAIIGPATVVNNIVAFNSSGISSGSYVPLVMRNNCVYNPDGADYVSLNPGVGDISVDPQLAAVQYGRVHLQPGSPCVDAGDDGFVANGSSDIDGQGRVQGSHMDIGADESDATTWNAEPVIVRVSTSGADGNDGSDWTHTKRTVQAGVDAAASQGGEVWVAAGTYAEQVSLRRGVNLYGGFCGTETSREARKPSAYRTILDGSNEGTVVSAIGGGYRTYAIDGFTIENGFGMYDGGGVYCHLASPVVSNNVITNNNAAGESGGGIYSWSSAPAIFGNDIRGNSALQDGGGLSFSFSGGTVIGNRITENSATYGAGIYCSCAPTMISGNTIARNSAEYGGGLCCGWDNGPTYGQAAMVTANTIVANTAASGGGIYSLGSSPFVTGNIIALNSSGICTTWTDFGIPRLSFNDVFNPQGYNYSGLSAGTSDFWLDPVFVDSVAADYHLSSNSPCINAGYNGAAGLPATDIDAQPRIWAETVDVGADEFEAAPVSVQLSVASGMALGQQSTVR